VLCLVVKGPSDSFGRVLLLIKETWIQPDGNNHNNHTTTGMNMMTKLDSSSLHVT